MIKKILNWFKRKKPQLPKEPKKTLAEYYKIIDEAIKQNA